MFWLIHFLGLGVFLSYTHHQDLLSLHRLKKIGSCTPKKISPWDWSVVKNSTYRVKLENSYLIFLCITLQEAFIIAFYEISFSSLPFSLSAKLSKNIWSQVLIEVSVNVSCDTFSTEPVSYYFCLTKNLNAMDTVTNKVVHNLRK